MIEELDQNFVFDELEIFPIWFKQKKEMSPNQKFLFQQLVINEINIFFFCRNNETNLKEEKLFRNIANYLCLITGKKSNYDIFDINQINDLFNKIKPIFLFFLGDASSYKKIDNLVTNSSQITLDDMINDAEKKKIFWHDVRSFLLKIKNEH